LEVVHTGWHVVEELGRHGGNFAQKTISLGSDPASVHDDAPSVDQPDSFRPKHERQQLAPSGDASLEDPEVEWVERDRAKRNDDLARASNRRIDIVQLDVAAEGVDAGGLHEAKALT
jgi:hypothetical protein